MFETKVFVSSCLREYFMSIRVIVGRTNEISQNGSALFICIKHLSMMTSHYMYCVLPHPDSIVVCEAICSMIESQNTCCVKNKYWEYIVYFEGRDGGRGGHCDPGVLYQCNISFCSDVYRMLETEAERFLI